VQDDTQKRSIDVQAAVVFDETEFPEFVHEKIYPGPRCADHFRKRFLGNSGQHRVDCILLAVTGEQEKRAGEPLFARIEKLIHQVLFDANVPGKHESDEPIGEGVLFVKYPEHFIFLNDEYNAQ
jgi:hypothetical protein